MNIIFLDFDGVLDNATYDLILEKEGKKSCDKNGRPIFDPECVRNLDKIIQSTDSKIVVTSSWREIDSLVALRDMWSERQMPGELIDVTPILNEERGDEIDKWLAMKADAHTRYIIIDDLPLQCFNPHHYNHLICINPINGITSKNMLEAISILKYNKYDRTRKTEFPDRYPYLGKATT